MGLAGDEAWPEGRMKVYLLSALLAWSQLPP